MNKGRVYLYIVNLHDNKIRYDGIFKLSNNWQITVWSIDRRCMSFDCVISSGYSGVPSGYEAPSEDNNRYTYHMVYCFRHSMQLRGSKKKGLWNPSPWKISNFLNLHSKITENIFWTHPHPPPIPRRIKYPPGKNYFWIRIWEIEKERHTHTGRRTDRRTDQLVFL